MSAAGDQPDEELRSRLAGCAPPPCDAAVARAEALAAISPLYRNHLLVHPDVLGWLELPGVRDRPFGATTLGRVFREKFAPGPGVDPVAALRRFRRQVSLRIAYRDVNGLATELEVLEELTALAEFCLGEIFRTLSARWEQRLGQPWDEALDRPATFCVLGLGKLGGGELNFCSDLDLIFFFEGSGHCRKGERVTQISNPEFFTRLCRDATAQMQERTADGFLYNIDLRLRPEGASGPLVRSLAAMENYYYAAGQTWERLAMIKARRVAGDAGLAEEFFEAVNSFRYPRYPPPSIVEEVAGVKIRIEKEVLGEARFPNDVKNGFGGIREIEFLVQAHQLLSAGRNPFLQTGSTLEALEKLTLYDLMPEAERAFLEEAYLFLRRVENRLQMREEKQEHALPPPGRQRGRIARSLGFESPGAFEERLGGVRERVHALYRGLFGENNLEEEVQEWTLLLSGKPPSPALQARLEGWFGERADRAPKTFGDFVRGGPHNLLTREHVTLFKEIADQFDRALAPLAHPQRTLARLARFAESYRARLQLLKTCASQPRFFDALLLLFDRSRFIHRLLCKHPEIMEEVLVTQLGRRKDRGQMEAEIGHLPPGATFPAYLWLYVKAEQVRVAAAEVLGTTTLEQTEGELTQLADAALATALARVDPEGELAVIALGKYGGREMACGSDLDALVVGAEPSARALKKTRALVKLLAHREPEGITFELDLRLRPHGVDGPLVTTPPALRAYLGSSAQTWERQMLTRARHAAGDPALAETFFEVRDEALFTAPVGAPELREIWAMRLRIQREKAGPGRPERDFKTGPGGLLDVEFLAQITQLVHGPGHPGLRTASTRETLAEAARAGLLPEAEVGRLLEHYGFLRRVEHYLRREHNTGVTRIADEAGERGAMAISKWLGFKSFKALRKELSARMKETRASTEALLREHFGPVDLPLE